MVAMAIAVAFEQNPGQNIDFLGFLTKTPVKTLIFLRCLTKTPVKTLIFHRFLTKTPVKTLIFLRFLTKTPVESRECPNSLPLKILNGKWCKPADGGGAWLPWL